MQPLRLKMPKTILTRRPAAALAAHPASAEVGLIYFDFTLRKGRGALALFGDALTDFEKDRGDALARQPGQLSGTADRQVEREVALAWAGNSSGISYSGRASTSSGIFARSQTRTST